MPETLGEVLNQLQTPAPAEEDLRPLPDLEEHENDAAPAPGEVLQTAREQEEETPAPAEAPAPAGVTGARIGNYIGGLPDEDTICTLGGLEDRSKLRKHPEFARALDAVANYQRICSVSHPLDDFVTYGSKNFIEDANASLGEVIAAIEGAEKRYRRWFASRSSTMKGLMIGFSQTLVKATMMLTRMAAIRPEIMIAYAASSGKSEMSLDEVLTSPVLEQMGNQSVTVEGPAAPDKAAAAYRAYQQGASRQDIYAGMRSAETESVLGRTLPPADSPNFMTEINSLLAALDNVTLSSEADSNETGKRMADARVPYYALVKLLISARQNLENPENRQLLDAVAGKTVQEAAAYCQQQVFSTVETLGASFNPEKHVTGGAASRVMLDFSNDRILRTSADVRGLDSDEARQNVEKNARNSYYDEALSALNRLFGTKVIAEASVVKYQDHEGKEHYGSQMALAKGKEAAKINFGLGDAAEYADVLLRTQDVKRNRETNEVISAADRPYYNLMDNPKMLGEILKLQVIDYVAASADRHANNFFLNPEAGEGEAMVTGIDNDRAFRENRVADLGSYAFHRGERQDNAADFKFGAYNAVTLRHGFSMITPEVKAMIEGVTLSQLRDTLRPYLNRVSLEMAVERLRTLQEYVQSAQVVDLNTPQGREQYAGYLKSVLFDTVASMMRFSSYTGNDGNLNISAAGGVSVAERTGNLAANVLMDSFVDTYFVGEGGRQFQLESILKALKKMGYRRRDLLERMRDRGRLQGAQKGSFTESDFEQYMNSPLFSILPA